MDINGILAHFPPGPQVHPPTLSYTHGCYPYPVINNSRPIQMTIICVRTNRIQVRCHFDDFEMVQDENSQEDDMNMQVVEEAIKDNALRLLYILLNHV